MSRRTLRALCAPIVFALCGLAHSASLTPAQVTEICKDAEDQSHCGRLIEDVQLKRLPGLAVRDGDQLRIALFPSGTVSFRDSVTIVGAKTYALWDYLDRINAVVLYTTDGDRSEFMLLQRTNGRQYRLPAEPVLSPDRQRIVTVDVCTEGCDGEIAVWRLTRDDLRKELAWKPQPAWADATATWKDPDTLVLDFVLPREETRRTQQRKLTDAGWSKFAAP